MALPGETRCYPMGPGATPWCYPMGLSGATRCYPVQVAPGATRWYPVLPGGTRCYPGDPVLPGGTRCYPGDPVLPGRPDAPRVPCPPVHTLICVTLVLCALVIYVTGAHQGMGHPVLPGVIRGHTH
jgi:hypothetical protein